MRQKFQVYQVYQRFHKNSRRIHRSEVDAQAVVSFGKIRCLSILLEGFPLPKNSLLIILACADDARYSNMAGFEINEFWASNGKTPSNFWGCSSHVSPAGIRCLRFVQDIHSHPLVQNMSSPGPNRIMPVEPIARSST